MLFIGIVLTICNAFRLTIIKVLFFTINENVYVLSISIALIKPLKPRLDLWITYEEDMIIISASCVTIRTFWDFGNSFIVYILQGNCTISWSLIYSSEISAIKYILLVLVAKNSIPVEMIIWEILSFKARKSYNKNSHFSYSKSSTAWSLN
jgi:hypothetical protein